MVFDLGPGRNNKWRHLFIYFLFRLSPPVTSCRDVGLLSGALLGMQCRVYRHLLTYSKTKKMGCVPIDPLHTLT